MFRLIDRYIFKQVFGAFCAVLTGIVLLFILIDIIAQRQELLTGGGVPLGYLAQYYVNYLPFIVVSVIPLAFLVTLLYVMGGLSRNNELIAMSASGIAFRRVYLVPVALGLTLSLGVLAINETILPQSQQRKAEIDREYLQGKIEQTPEQPIAYSAKNGKRRVYIDRYSTDLYVGKGITIVELGEEEFLTYILTASELRWNGIEQRWYVSGWLEQRIGWNEPNQRWEVVGWQDGTTATVLRQAPLEESPETLHSRSINLSECNLVALWRWLRTSEQMGVPVKEYWVRFHEKLSLPFTTLIITFLAVPFAIRLRHSGLLVSLGLGVGVSLCYIALSRTTVVLGQSYILPPLLAAWLPNLLFAAVGVSLSTRTRM